MSRREELAKLKEILILRKDALRRALAGDLSSLKALADQSIGDEVDFALDSAYDEMNSRLAEIESQELAKIDAALERMREGSYGVCEITGKPIPMARLQALPYATTTIEAQRELERARANNEEEPDLGRILDGDAIMGDVEFA